VSNLGIEPINEAQTLGSWLHRTQREGSMMTAWQQVNNPIQD